METVKERLIAPGKEWCTNLSQEQFETEFKSHYPHSDYIPGDVNEWKYIEFRDQSRFRRPLIDPTEPEEPKEINPDDLTLYCKGCKKDFKAFQRKGKGPWYPATLALSNHERHCKKLLEIRV